MMYLYFGELETMRTERTEQNTVVFIGSCKVSSTRVEEGEITAPDYSHHCLPAALLASRNDARTFFDCLYPPGNAVAGPSGCPREQSYTPSATLLGPAASDASPAVIGPSSSSSALVTGVPSTSSTPTFPSAAPSTSPLTLGGAPAAASPQQAANVIPHTRRAAPAASVYGSAGCQRARRLERYHQRAEEAHTIKAEGRQAFRTYHGLPASAAILPVTDVASLCRVVEEERAEQALPPLANTRHLIERCPPLFRTLARGGRLEPLIERGILVQSAWDTSEEGKAVARMRKPMATNSSGNHVVSFYVREWVPPAGIDVAHTMATFGQDFPLQRDYVQSTQAHAQFVRYVGLCVDGEPMRRVAEDGNATSVHQTRLIEFMTTRAPTEQWRTFEIPELALQVPSPNSMPLTDLLAKFPGALGDISPLPIQPTRTVVLKAFNRTAGSVEACLIYCCRRGAVCLKSAGYGVLDVQPPLRRPRHLGDLRTEVQKACGDVPFAPTSHSRVDPILFGQMHGFYTSASNATQSTASPQILASNALYAAIPSRWLHELKDVTLEDLNRDATRLGNFAGPGLSSFRNALSWALGGPVSASGTARAQEDLAHLKTIGASVDLWPMSRQQKTSYIPVLVNLLVDVMLLRKRAGLLGFVVVHSAQVYDLLIQMQGLADGSPLRYCATSPLESTHYYLEFAGTMDDLRVGRIAVPALAVFDAGYVKYDGDDILRAELHTLAHVSAQMTRITDWQVWQSEDTDTSAKAVISRAQAAADRSGLKTELSKLRDRVASYVWAHKSLQALPSLLQHAQAAPEAFEARETSYQRRGTGLVKARSRKNALFAEADRKAQINTLLAAGAAAAGITTDINAVSGAVLLASLPVLAHIVDLSAQGSMEAWKIWMRKRRTGSNVTQAAYATRSVKGEQKRPNRHKRDLVTPRIRKLERGPNKFWGQITVQKARDTVASGRLTRFGYNEPTTLYRCRRCAYTGIVNAHIPSFLHLCSEGEVIEDANDQRFTKRRVEFADHVDRLVAEYGLQ